MDTNQTVAKKSKQFAIHVMKLVEHLRKISVRTLS